MLESMENCCIQTMKCEFRRQALAATERTGAARIPNQIRLKCKNEPETLGIKRHFRRRQLLCAPADLYLGPLGCQEAQPRNRGERQGLQPKVVSDGYTWVHVPYKGVLSELAR